MKKFFDFLQSAFFDSMYFMKATEAKIIREISKKFPEFLQVAFWNPKYLV